MALFGNSILLSQLGHLNCIALGSLGGVYVKLALSTALASKKVSIVSLSVSVIFYQTNLKVFGF